MFVSSYDRDLEAPIELQQGSHALSRVEVWDSTFLSSCKRGVRPPVEFRRGTWAFSRGATVESDLPLCCEGKLGVPFESLNGNLAVSLVEGEFGVLSTCGRNCGVPLGFQ